MFEHYQTKKKKKTYITVLYTSTQNTKLIKEASAVLPSFGVLGP